MEFIDKRVKGGNGKRDRQKEGEEGEGVREPGIGGKGLLASSREQQGVGWACLLKEQGSVSTDIGLAQGIGPGTLCQVPKGQHQGVSEY